MAQEAGGDEMESVKKYFNTAGFERWNKIYGTTQARRPRASPRHAVAASRAPPAETDSGGAAAAPCA